MKDSLKYKSWLEIAKKELGVHEIPGHDNNKRILEYHQATSLKASDDETSWCAAFVNWVLKQSNIKGTNSALARSFATWGVEIDDCLEGAICVLWRGTKASATGHVGFCVAGGKKEGVVKLLGGNQGDKVCISSYPVSRILTIRWPTEAKLP